LIKPSNSKSFLKFIGRIAVDITIIQLIEKVFNYAGIINDEEKKQLITQFEEHAKLMNTDRDGQITAALKLGIDLKNKNKIEIDNIFNPTTDEDYSLMQRKEIGEYVMGKR